MADEAKVEVAAAPNAAVEPAASQSNTVAPDSAAVPGSAVEANRETVSSTQDETKPKPDSKGNPIISRLIKQRDEARTKQNELMAKLDELNKAHQEKPVAIPNNVTPSQGKTIWDDPDSFLAERESRILAQAEERVYNRIKEEQGKHTRYERAVEAENWLLSLPDVQSDPAVADEIAAIIESDSELKDIAPIAPKKALSLAYQVWKEGKGISNGKAKNPSAARAGSVRPSGSSSASPSRKDSFQQLVQAASQLDPRSPDYHAKWADIQKSLKELAR